MNIYVGNIPFRTTEGDLQQAFGAYGTVTSVKIVSDRLTGRSRGFGFVEMEDDEAGRSAINGLNGKELNGRVLNVSEARQRDGGDRGGRDGGGRGGRGGDRRY